MHMTILQVLLLTLIIVIDVEIKYQNHQSYSQFNYIYNISYTHL